MSKKTDCVAFEKLFFSKTYDFLEIYLPKQACRSRHTIKQYKTGLSCFFDYVSDVRMLSPLSFTFIHCTYKFLLEYRQYLGEDQRNAASTINCRFAAIRSYLEYVSDGDASIIPVYLVAERVPSAPVPKVRRPVIEAADLAAFLDSPAHTWKGNRDRFILVLLYDTAIRVEELVSIRLGDIVSGSSASSILIHGKGRKERCIVLSDKASEHLNAYISVYHDAIPDPNCPLIYTVIHGEIHPMSVRNVERMLHKYGQAAKATNPNIPDSVHPHMMRRTRACGLYQDGVPMEQVAALLGHSHIETTRTHYAEPSKKQMQESMKKGTEREPDKKEWLGNTDEIKRKFGLL